MQGRCALEVLIGRNGACPKLRVLAAAAETTFLHPTSCTSTVTGPLDSHGPAETLPKHSAFFKCACAGIAAASTWAILIRCFVALLSTAQSSNGTCDHGHSGAAEDTTHEFTTLQWG